MHDLSMRNPEYQSLTDQELHEIDALCDRFDRELLGNTEPSIESFLTEVSVGCREHLLAELLAMQFEFATRHGNGPQEDEYFRRFADHRDVVARAFDQVRRRLADGVSSPFRGAGGGPTIGTGSGDTEGDPDTERFGGERDFRRFLEPSNHPGWLGRLAHFEIERILGQGAFGIVAKAYDEKLHRVVAIKMLIPHLAATSPPRQRFLREARAAAAVTHENIVAIYDTHEAPIPYLVMEFVPGPTLQERMNETGPMKVAEVLQIGQQIASGLAAAHAVNLIHRDIKPSNILLAGGLSDRVKISDFGMARAVDDASMTRSGMIAGTPMYMAPEQARGETLDYRADLFSLGSVLYQMASGRPPFWAINTMAVLKRVCEDTPRPLDDVIPETSRWLQSIIFRLLEKNREDRFQSAQEVADLLRRCQRELERSENVVSAAASIPAVSNGSGPTSTTRPAWRRPLSVAVLCVMAVLIPLFIGPRLQRWIAAPDSNLTHAETNGRTAVDRAEQSAGHVTNIAPAVRIDKADVAIVLLEGSRRILDVADHGVEVHVIVNGGEQIVQHAQRMDFDFLKRNTLLDPYFAHGWYANSVAEWSDFRAIHFPPDVNRNHSIWGARTNRVNSLIGSVIIASGPDDSDPFVEAQNVRTESTGLGPWVHVTTNDHEGAYGVANGSIYLSDRGWLELCWMGEKESVINSHKTYYLPSETTLHDLGFRPGTSHTWEDEVFGTVTLVIQPGTDAEILSLLHTGKISASGSPDRNSTTTSQGWTDDTPLPAISPFDADLASQFQESWAKHLGVPVEYENSIGMKFRLVPPGEFLMGSTPAQIEAALEVVVFDDWREKIASESPQHKVVLTKPVYFGVTEVTQMQYEQIMGVNPALFSATGRGKEIILGMDTGDYPVDTVSWNDAAEFCARLSEKEALPPFDFHSSEVPSSQAGTGYRLATDAEWEYACRAGTSTLYWSGDKDQDLRLVGWIRQNAGNRTHAVGELAANPFGLFDVHGNVWEWVMDSWEPAYYSRFQQNVATDPFCTGHNSRLFRGGNANSSPAESRTAFRLALDASRRPEYVGLRVVLSVDAVKKALQTQTVTPGPR